MANPVNNIYSAYKTLTINPLINTAIWGGLTYFGVKKGLPLILNAVLQGAAATQGKAHDVKSMLQAKRGLELVKKSKWYSEGIPITAASIISLALLADSFNSKKLGYGLLSWYPKDKKGLVKTLSLNVSQGYQPSFNFNQVVDINSVNDIFRHNPILQSLAYARNFGTSIINAAPHQAFNTTTLGGIYDSAVNKFLNKMNFTGIAKAGLKGLIAGSLAGMFTDTIGTVMGMPANIRTPITKSTALGSALYSILT